MVPGDQYRVKAAEMAAIARAEADPFQKAEYERLALSYVRLADQADRNAQTDLTYETPMFRSGAETRSQQQQQSQPKKAED